MEILSILWVVLESPVVVAGIASLVAWGLARLWAKKPSWRRYEGTIIAAIRYAEKTIPDDTPNKAEKKLDLALQYVLKVMGLNGEKAPNKIVQQELREGIQIVHAKQEAAQVAKIDAMGVAAQVAAAVIPVLLDTLTQPTCVVGAPQPEMKQAMQDTVLEKWSPEALAATNAAGDQV